MDRKELKLRVTGRIWKEQQNPETGVCMPTFVANAKVILKTSTRFDVIPVPSFSSVLSWMELMKLLFFYK
jgi:hypothetical protein